MLAVTNLDTVLDTIFKEKEFQLYCKIGRADVGEKVALMDFFKELRSAKGKLIRKYKASDEWEKLRCDLQMGRCPVKTAPGQNGPVSDSQNGPVSDSQNGPVSDSQNGPIQMTYLIITVYMDLYHKIIRFLFRFIFICSRCHEYKNPNPI